MYFLQSQQEGGTLQVFYMTHSCIMYRTLFSVAELSLIELQRVTQAQQNRISCRCHTVNIQNKKKNVDLGFGRPLQNAVAGDVIYRKAKRWLQTRAAPPGGKQPVRMRPVGSCVVCGLMQPSLGVRSRGSKNGLLEVSGGKVLVRAAT